MDHNLGVRLISSQRHLDIGTVLQKQNEEDYSVYVVVFSLGDESFGLILDGHHSLIAAERNEVVPEWDLSDVALVIDSGMDVALWLELEKIDSEYYDWNTGDIIEGHLKKLCDGIKRPLECPNNQQA